MADLDAKRTGGNDLAWRRSRAGRLRAELNFARGLAAIRGASAEGWEDLLLCAEARFEEATGGSLGDLDRALAEAEAILAPIGPVAKSFTVHCIGHGQSNVVSVKWLGDPVGAYHFRNFYEDGKMT